MRLPKKDQNLLAEAYDSVLTPDASYTPRERSPEQHNNRRILNQIYNGLSTRGLYDLRDGTGIRLEDGSSLHIYGNKADTIAVVIQISKDKQYMGALVSSHPKAGKILTYNGQLITSLQRAADILAKEFNGHHSSYVKPEQGIQALFREIELDL